MIWKVKSKNKIKELESLIKEGKSFTFQQNSNSTRHGTFGKVSSTLFAWTVKVEDYIIKNYGEESAPFGLYKTSDISQLNGNGQSEFDNQLTILNGALEACRSISTVSHKAVKDEGKIISLIKNPHFWTVSGSVATISFSLGMYFGYNKFDKEKYDCYTETTQLQDKLVVSEVMISRKDSVIANLKATIDSLSSKVADE